MDIPGTTPSRCVLLILNIFLSLLICTSSSAIKQLSIEIGIGKESRVFSFFLNDEMEELEPRAVAFVREHSLWEGQGCRGDQNCVVDSLIQAAMEAQLIHRGPAFLRDKQAAPSKVDLSFLSNEYLETDRYIHTHDVDKQSSTKERFPADRGTNGSIIDQREVAVIALYTGHDASVTMTIGGRVQCVLELERLHDVRYFMPSEENKTAFRDAWVDALVALRDNCVCDTGIACPRAFHFGVIVKWSMNSFNNEMRLRQLVEDVFGSGEERTVQQWRNVDHHSSHANVGFFSSSFRSAVVVSFDGGGNDGFFNVYVGKYSHLKRIKRFDFNFGGMYRFLASLLPEVTGNSIEALCQHEILHASTSVDANEIKLLNFQNWLSSQSNTIEKKIKNVRSLSYPGKLMGYSATGRARDGPLLEELYGLFNNSGRLIDVTYVGKLPPRHLLETICSGIEGQRDAAATIQRAFETVAVDAIGASLLAASDGDIAALARSFDGIVLVGGCALNVLVNQLVAKRFGMRVFVPPNPGDEGLSIGGAWGVVPPPTRAPLQYLGFGLWDDNNRYLAEQARARNAINLSVRGGPEFLAALLTSHRNRSDSSDGDESSDQCAQAIVALVRGRQEHGPRALGHRSLLALPDSEKIRDRLNALKHRQWYRPVAPMIVHEDLDAVFGHEAFTESPYMSLAPAVLPKVRAIFPAIAHLDGTARHQSVSKDNEPWLWALLRAVARRTGLGVLINTSFNTRGHPIVNTIRDSLEMLDTLPDLDYVIIENWLFSKKPGQRKRDLMCGIHHRPASLME